MSKELYWQVIDAKKSHRKWVGYAQLLIERGEVDEKMVPTNETECCFGQWYYAEGQVFSDLTVFKKIGLIHEQLHEKYNEIFSLLFFKEEQGFFKRLLGKKSTVSDSNISEAKKIFQELNNISHELTDEIDKLIKEIKINEKI